MAQTLSVLLPTLIIFISMFSDLKTKKVKNSLVLTMGVLAFAVAVGLEGWKAVPWSLLSVSTVFFFGFPLFIMGVLGAGDVKVLMAFSVLVSWDAAIFVGVSSLVWGAALGVAQSLVAGQGKTLVLNAWGVFRHQKSPERSELHFIPFTVAMMFGWASYLVQTQSSFFGGWV